MSRSKTLQELTIKDGFMFFALMDDTAICKELIELILDMEIEEISVSKEESIMYHPKFHGIRLDVIAVENGRKRKFNVEMQAEKRSSLEKRSRYYHSQIDMDMIGKGTEYDELKENYVIFICDFDPFGDGLYRYNYEMTCLQNNRLLKDGTHTVFLNSKGTVKDTTITQNLIAFLDYVANPDKMAESSDEFVAKVEQRIQSIRVDREWEAQYMLLRETLREERAEGRAEGEAKGEINKAKEVVSNLQNMGLEVEQIAKIVNIRVEQVQEWLNGEKEQ